MFKLSKERKVWWPVRLPVTDEAGVTATITIRALFRLLKAEELAAMRTAPLLQAQEAGTSAASVEAIVERINMAEREMTARVAASVFDWRGVVDAESGEEVPFSAEVLATALEYADVRQAFATGLREASTGATPKN